MIGQDPALFFVPSIQPGKSLKCPEPPQLQPPQQHRSRSCSRCSSLFWPLQPQNSNTGRIRANRLAGRLVNNQAGGAAGGVKLIPPPAPLVDKLCLPMCRPLSFCSFSVRRRGRIRRTRFADLSRFFSPSIRRRVGSFAPCWVIQMHLGPSQPSRA